MAGIPEVLEAIAALDVKINAIAQRIEDLEMDIYRICTMCQGTGTIIPSHNHSVPPSAYFVDYNHGSDIYSGKEPTL